MDIEHAAETTSNLYIFLHPSFNERDLAIRASSIDACDSNVSLSHCLCSDAGIIEIIVVTKALPSI